MTEAMLGTYWNAHMTDTNNRWTMQKSYSRIDKHIGEKNILAKVKAHPLPVD